MATRILCERDAGTWTGVAERTGAPAINPVEPILPARGTATRAGARVVLRFIMLMGCEKFWGGWSAEGSEVPR